LAGLALVPAAATAAPTINVDRSQTAAIAHVKTATGGRFEHPDAELLALGREFDAAHETETRLWNAAHAVLDEDAAEAARNCTLEIVEEIAALPARTLDGLRVKARVYRDWIAPAQMQPGSELLPDRMLLLILDDLAGNATSATL